jgi:phosphohistidine phosphatase
MLLYVMRHGPAEDRASSGRDFDRVLTPAGRAVVARAARQLGQVRQVGGVAGRLRVLASPLRRARETAEIVAGALSRPPDLVHVELHDDLAVDAGLPLGLVRQLAAAGTDALLVGHQPTVEDLARRILQPGRTWLPGGFRTATIITAELVAAPDRWQAGAVLDPPPADP